MDLSGRWRACRLVGVIFLRECSAENEHVVQEKLSRWSCVTATHIQAPRAPGRATPTELNVVFGPWVDAQDGLFLLGIMGSSAADKPGSILKSWQAFWILPLLVLGWISSKHYTKMTHQSFLQTSSSVSPCGSCNVQAHYCRWVPTAKFHFFAFSAALFSLCLPWEVLPHFLLSEWIGSGFMILVVIHSRSSERFTVALAASSTAVWILWSSPVRTGCLQREAKARQIWSQVVWQCEPPIRQISGWFWSLFERIVVTEPQAVG